MNSDNLIVNDTKTNILGMSLYPITHLKYGSKLSYHEKDFERLIKSFVTLYIEEHTGVLVMCRYFALHGRRYNYILNNEIFKCFEFQETRFDNLKQLVNFFNISVVNPYESRQILKSTSFSTSFLLFVEYVGDYDN